MGGPADSRHSTRRCFAKLGAAILLAVALAAPASAGVGPGAAAPDFALKNQSGENVRLSEFRGTTVLLSFWASWCGQCREQIAELAALRRQRPAANVAVVIVSVDADRQIARELAERHGLTVLADTDQSVARQYDLGDLPLTILIDPDGNIRHTHAKFRRGDERLYAGELDALLQQ